MKKYVFLFMKNHGVLIGSFFVAFFLFFLFLHLQNRGSDILKLDTKWLFVAGVPILIGLFAGGYIRHFKGFGIELEARIKRPLSQNELKALNFEFKAMEVMGSTEAVDKGSDTFIQDMPEIDKMKIQRLSFRSGQRTFYVGHVVESYFYELKNLKYIEIQDSDGKFYALLPFEVFTEQNISPEKFLQIIQSVASIENELASFLIKNTVVYDENILNILPKFLEQDNAALAVLKRDKAIGVIEKCSFLETFANLILTERYK